jgi:hypothetical protein
VPQATEEAVLAVTSLYPTLLSLAQAYAMLVSLLSLSSYAMLFSFSTLKSHPQVRTSVSMHVGYLCLIELFNIFVN